MKRSGPQTSEVLKTSEVSFQIIVLMIFSLLISPCPCFADNVLQISAGRQFAFAEQHFSRGNYTEAISEYQRFIYFFPKDSRVMQAMFKTGMAYFNSEKYKKAVNAFSTLTGRYYDEELSISSPVTHSYFMISQCYKKLNAPGQAIAALHNLMMLTKKKDIHDESYYRIGWICLETGSWEKAGSFFRKISQENQDKYRIKRLAQEMSKTGKIPRKNPAIAGTLSLIPGAGFLYCGRYRDALTAFVLNGGLILGAYKAFDDGNTALGGIISLVELGFYTGNFYGSVSSAHKYNRNTTRDFIERLKENTRLNLSAGNNNKISLSLTYSF